MAAARQGLPVRLDRAPQRGAAFALTRASRRARTRSIGSRSRASRSRARGSSLIFNHPPAVARPPSPGPAHYLVARDHRLPALRHEWLSSRTKVKSAGAGGSGCAGTALFGSSPSAGMSLELLIANDAPPIATEKASASSISVPSGTRTMGYVGLGVCAPQRLLPPSSRSHVNVTSYPPQRSQKSSGSKE